MPLSPWELAMIFGILLLLFGASQLPKLGRSLGSGIREFKQAVTGDGLIGKGEDDGTDTSSVHEK